MKVLYVLFTGAFLVASNLLSVSAWAAAIPPEVMTAYKGYTAALKAKDPKLAMKHAMTAWDKAEELLGENKLTGDLAYNYGYLAISSSKLSEAVLALERAAILAQHSGENSGLIRLEREELLISVLIADSKRKAALNRAKLAREFAQTHDLDDSLFAGEIMVHQARLKSTNANQTARRGGGGKLGTRREGAETRSARIQSRSADYAEDAITIFDGNPETARKTYKAVAYKLIGFSHERDKEWLEAALAYQKSMLLQKEGGLNDSGYATTLGRWINARNYLKRGDGLEAAVEQGLCKCWPYDKETGVRPVSIKLTPPIMPIKAKRVGISGFTILKYDLDDKGKVINPEVVHSWPEKLYDKSSLTAVKKWQYESKVEGPSDAQRTGLIQTIHYFLSDWKGDPV